MKQLTSGLRHLPCGKQHSRIDELDISMSWWILPLERFLHAKMDNSGATTCWQ
jgi:hypothetical protein